MEVKRERRWDPVYRAACEAAIKGLVLFLAFYSSALLFPVTLLA